MTAPRTRTLAPQQIVAEAIARELRRWDGLLTAADYTASIDELAKRAAANALMSLRRRGLRIKENAP